MLFKPNLDIARSFSMYLLEKKLKHREYTGHTTVTQPWLGVQKHKISVCSLSLDFSTTEILLGICGPVMGWLRSLKIRLNWESACPNGKGLCLQLAFDRSIKIPWYKWVIFVSVQPYVKVDRAQCSTSQQRTAEKRPWNALTQMRHLYHTPSYKTQGTS